MDAKSRADKWTGRNQYMMSIAMNQAETFWLDFEHSISELKIKGRE